MHDPFAALEHFRPAPGREGVFYSLPRLESAGLGPISRLPVSIRIVLESVLRNCDGRKVREQDVRMLAAWCAKKPATEEIPFVVARIVLQDFTGVPLLVDLAAMRNAVAAAGKDPAMIEPLVPVDLVVDHSVQVDFFGSADALRLNLDMEFKRNRERYQFLKWGQQAFKTFGVVPPGIGIVHQVNLEYLAKGVLSQSADGRELYYPDTLVGTDSHTTMINGLGVVGWGVGGIEAEAGMLGQPVYFLTPEVVGVNLTGRLREGVTATDLALHVTELLRKTKVVGKFVEFYGEGAASLPLPDRATIANMAPEYGATMGYFPVDSESVNYLRGTGRTDAQCAAFEAYFRAQQMFGMPKAGDIDYSTDLGLDLAAVQPGVAGPKRPQDRIDLPDLKTAFGSLLERPVAEGGYNKPSASRGKPAEIKVVHPRFEIPADEEKQVAEMEDDRPTPDNVRGRAGRGAAALDHGSVVIAAITSCTNTSNPSVMIGAGLVARKAAAKGLTRKPWVKTSLAPGSRVVTDYLQKSGLDKDLEKLGFHTVGYGCTTCIGNSGPLPEPVANAVNAGDLVVSSVLSGNRNFEGRVNPLVKANYLASPPLVVAYAIAGTTDIDLVTEPLGQDADGNDVFLKDVWPTQQEVADAVASSMSPEQFIEQYASAAAGPPQWQAISSSDGDLYEWVEDSTYVQEPPFFVDMPAEPSPIKSIEGARCLVSVGDSTTTDHISPAGAIKPASPAGKFLQESGVDIADFNSYGSRRGNDRVMTRGT
ncbi:MAG: aconitate hydratase AcnA, partial [Verrucomicrobia bacterium]|nr:aconitate hydratase AcnA [Verrucomicrobiota bacterium]